MYLPLMKAIKLFVLGFFALTTFSFMACNDTAKGAEKDAAEAKAKMEAEFKEQKTQMQKELQDTKSNINAEIAKLEASLENASDDAKESINAQLNQLKSWSADVDNQMNKLANATAENWNDVKTELSSWGDSMKKGWNSFLESMKADS